VVGGQERIDTDVADTLVTRLHAAGLDLHRVLALPLTDEMRGHIESAVAEIDSAIQVVRRAAMSVESPGESGSPP